MSCFRRNNAIITEQKSYYPLPERSEGEQIGKYHILINTIRTHYGAPVSLVTLYQVVYRSQESSLNYRPNNQSINSTNDLVYLFRWIYLRQLWILNLVSIGCWCDNKKQCPPEQHNQANNDCEPDSIRPQLCQCDDENPCQNN